MNKLVLAGVAVGFLAAAGAGGWFLFAAEAGPSPEDILVEQARIAQAEEIHEVALFSYVDPAPGNDERSSMPVMLMLGVKGSDGLGAFCNAMPRLKEVVLRVFEDPDAAPRRRDGEDWLDRFSEPLRAAINRIVAGGPVERVKASYLWDAGIGGAASYRTDGMCREVTLHHPPVYRFGAAQEASRAGLKSSLSRLSNAGSEHNL